MDGQGIDEAPLTCEGSSQVILRHPCSALASPSEEQLHSWLVYQLIPRALQRP